MARRDKLGLSQGLSFAMLLRIPRGGRDKKLPPHIAQDMPSRLFLFDVTGRLIVGDVESSSSVTRIPLVVAGQSVGYLGFIPVKEITDDRHLLFLEQQELTYTLVAGVIVVLAVLLSFLLARRLVRPIRKLAGRNPSSGKR